MHIHNSTRVNNTRAHTHRLHQHAISLLCSHTHTRHVAVYALRAGHNNEQARSGNFPVPATRRALTPARLPRSLGAPGTLPPEPHPPLVGSPHAHANGATATPSCILPAATLLLPRARARPPLPCCFGRHRPLLRWRCRLSHEPSSTCESGMLRSSQSWGSRWRCSWIERISESHMRSVSSITPTRECTSS
jgi:hypothetical protein